MPESHTTKVLTAVTTDGNKDIFEVRNQTAISFFITATGGTSATIAVYGTADPRGESGFAALAIRTHGGGPYATTAQSVTPAAPLSLYLDPSDNISYIRLVVAAQTGPTTLNAWMNTEL